jgi:hypothetical protein
MSMKRLISRIEESTEKTPRSLFLKKLEEVAGKISPSVKVSVTGDNANFTVDAKHAKEAIQHFKNEGIWGFIGGSEADKTALTKSAQTASRPVKFVFDLDAVDSYDSY